MLLKALRSIKFYLTVLFTDASFIRSYVHNRYYLNRIRCSGKKKSVVFISLIEHVGDLIAATPLLQAISEKHKHDTIVFFTAAAYKPLLSSNKFINKLKTVSCFAEWVLLKKYFINLTLYDMNLPGKACKRYPFSLPYRDEMVSTSNYYNEGNLLHAFAKAANFQIDSSAAPNLFFPYPKNFRLSLHPYIIIHTTANETERMWNSNGWKQLAKFVATQKPHWKIIEVGLLKQVEINLPQYIDYTGIKPLDELTGLINNSALFIGVDSAFAHIANALQKESMILLGHYAHFTNYLPYSGYYLEKEADMVVHYKGAMEQMPFTFIKPKLLKKLNSLNKA